MDEIMLKIENLTFLLETKDADILCVEKNGILKEVVSSSVLTLKWGKERNIIRIKFDWKESNELSENDFLFIPETSTLFFRSINQWAAFDLRSKLTLRHEHAMWYPYIEKINQTILIEDDMQAESTNLYAQQIDVVPIDPPWERF